MPRGRLTYAAAVRATLARGACTLRQLRARVELRMRQVIGRARLTRHLMVLRTYGKVVSTGTGEDTRWSLPPKQKGSVLVYLVGIICVMGLAYVMLKFIDSRWETDAGIRKGAADTAAKWAEANRLTREREATQAGAAATKVEEGHAKARIVYRTITREVDKLVERPVYRSVCLDDDGVRLANAALDGGKGPATREPDGPVRAALAAYRWEWELGLAKAD